MLDKGRITESHSRSRTETFSDVEGKFERPDQAVDSFFEIDDQRCINDSEGVISIDREAIRIGYMSQPGWGRHGIADGPFKNTSGLFFSVFVYIIMYC